MQQTVDRLLQATFTNVFKQLERSHLKASILVAFLFPLHGKEYLMSIVTSGSAEHLRGVSFAITGCCAAVLLFICLEIQYTHIPLANLFELINSFSIIMFYLF